MACSWGLWHSGWGLGLSPCWLQVFASLAAFSKRHPQALGYSSKAGSCTCALCDPSCEPFPSRSQTSSCTERGGRFSAWAAKTASKGTPISLVPTLLSKHNSLFLMCTQRRRVMPGIKGFLYYYHCMCCFKNETSGAWLGGRRGGTAGPVLLTVP